MITVPKKPDKRYRREGVKELLVQIYTTDFKVTARKAAEIARCSTNYAADVKHWMKRGSVGDVEIRSRTRYYHTKNHTKADMLVEVICLSHENMCKFMSESTHVRTCPECRERLRDIISSGMEE